MLRRVALVSTDVSEELRASFIRVTRIGELGTIAVTGVVPSSPILVTLMKEALSCSKRQFTRLNIPEVAILHSHRRDNLKSYMMPQGLLIVSS
jgi:hypothetical protein